MNDKASMEDISLSLGIPSHVTCYMDDRAWLEGIATAGFSLIINLTPHGSEYFDTTYPVEWQEEYVDKMYLWADPVMLSTIYSGNHEIRWSEIRLPDIAGVFKAARKFGLNYGAKIARKKGFGVSVCSLSRHDRELTDQEIQAVALWFDRLLVEIDRAFELSDGEVAVIKHMARGMTRDQVAQHLCVSYGTIKNRLRTARAKTKCTTDEQLVARLVKRL